MGIEPTWPAWKAGTLPLSYARGERKFKAPGSRLQVNGHNRDRHPPQTARCRKSTPFLPSTWNLHLETLNSLLMVDRGGFEPPKAEPSDLQSDPFGRSGTCPPNERAIADCGLTATGSAEYLPRASRCQSAVSRLSTRNPQSAIRNAFVEPAGGFGPPTPGLQNRCSTVELRRRAPPPRTSHYIAAIVVFKPSRPQKATRQSGSARPRPVYRGGPACPASV